MEISVNDYARRLRITRGNLRIVSRIRRPLFHSSEKPDFAAKIKWFGDSKIMVLIFTIIFTIVFFDKALLREHE